MKNLFWRKKSSVNKATRFYAKRVGALFFSFLIIFHMCALTTYTSDSEFEDGEGTSQETEVSDPDGYDGYDEPDEANELDGQIFSTFSEGFSLYSLDTCEHPEYCQDGACLCKNNAGDDCTCAADCLCRTAATRTCFTTSKCTNINCLCTTNKDLCICVDCLCMWPDFNTYTKTAIIPSNAVTGITQIESGKIVKVEVNYKVSSTETTCSDIELKVYIPKSMEPLNYEDIDGEFSFDRLVEETAEGVEYWVIVLKGKPGASSDAFSGMFNLYSRFYAGLTADGETAEIYTVIEGKIGGMSFGEKQNEEIVSGICEAEVAETQWNITLKNAELDYKDPDDNDTNIFRLEVEIQRSPNGNEGVEYLKAEDSYIEIALPDDYPTNGLKVLRVTAGGSDVDYVLNGNVMKIKAEDLFSMTNGYSSADNALFNIVFELDKTYIDSKAVHITNGFYVLDDLDCYAAFFYTLASSSSKQDDDETQLEVIIYEPGSKGGGSIGKSAKPYIEGKTFFTATGAADHSPIKYTIGYTNNSNSPVKDLVITDERPKIYKLVNGSLAASAAPAASVFFTKVTLTGWSGNTYYKGTGLSCVVSSSDGTVLGTLNNVGDAVSISNTAIDGMKIAFVGTTDIELMHGYHASFEITAAGAPGLADLAEQATRNEINFIENTAKFTAISTKDAGNTILKGTSDSALVHVRPYDNAEPKVWHVSLQTSADAAGTFADTTDIARSRYAYYKILVWPQNDNQYVYDPVFYLELPPEVQYQDIASFNGLTGNNFDVAVMNNPVGAGKMLKIFVPPDDDDKVQLMNKESEIVVQCRVSADAPQGTVVPSRAYFGVADANTPLDIAEYTNGISTDKYTLATGGFSGEPILLEADAKISVSSSGYIEGELLVQTELDRETDAWHRYPEIAKALPGGLLTYQYVVRNGGSQDAENLVLYNVFSHENDKYIIGNSTRSSYWKPYLIGPVALPPDLAGKATVYYSEYDTHRVYNDGRYEGVDDWTEEPYDFTLVKAIKIVFSAPLPAHKTLNIYVPMYSPVDFEAKAITAENQAVSSLAAVFKFTGSSSMSALEPIKTIVELVKNSKGEISGLVWGDTSPKDGLKTNLGTTEFPETGSKVLLYAYNGSGWDEKDFVLTDGDGKYKFTNLSNGIYQLRVAIPAGYAAGGAGADNKFTVANISGYVATADIIIDASAEATRVYKDIDAGIVPPPSKISGTVWRSLDGETSSARGSYSPGPDIGLAGVKVMLYRLTGGGDATGLPNKKYIGETTTDANGGYSFTNVYAGRYIVVFDKPANYNYAIRYGSDPDKDILTPGKPNYEGYSQAAQKDGNGQILGQSYEIWLKGGADQAGVDCGLVPDKGSISGVVWRDANGDGVKGAGESGSIGQKVTISSDDAYFPAGYEKTIVIDSGGEYIFENLNPGTYKVTLEDDLSGKEYLSYFADPIAEAARVIYDGTCGYGSMKIDPGLGAAATFDYTGRDFGLVRKITVSGSIFNDTNYSKKFDGTDEKLAFDTAKVIVSRAANSGGDKTAFTSTSVIQPVGTTGDYTIEVWPGTYTVKFDTGCVSGNDAPNSPLTDYDKYLTVTPEAVSGASFVVSSRTWTLTGLACSDAAAVKGNINLPLTRPRSISGYAWLDADGGGIKDGTEAIMADRTFALLSRSDTPTVNDGTGYRFDKLYPGTYTVTVTTTGGYLITNANVSTPNASGQYSVTISNDDAGPSADLKDIKFGLALPVTITGTAWWDKDLTTYLSDGKYTAGTDELLSSQTGIAKLYKKTNGNYNPSGSLVGTNLSGVYEFTGLPPGDYKVVLSPDANTYFLNNLDNTTPRTAHNNVVAPVKDEVENTVTWSEIVLYSGETAERIDLAVGKYAAISGTLWHDLNGDGTMDNSEEPITIPEIFELYHYGGAKIGETTTHATAGTYSFGEIKPGKYTVKFKQGARRVTNPANDDLFINTVVANLADSTAEWTVDHAAAATLTYPNKNILLSVYSSIAGSVWVDKDADGTADAGESAVADALVKLDYVSGPYIGTWWTTYADKTVSLSGHDYKFENLWPGTYSVTISRASDGLGGYVRTNTIKNGDTSFKQTFEVLSDDTVENVDFGLIKPSALSGEIWRDTEYTGVKSGLSALVGATVNLTRTDVTTGVVNTDVAGASLSGVISGLFPGTYTMTVGGSVTADWLRTFYEGTLNASGGAGTSATIAQSGTDDKTFTITITDGTGDGVTVTQANIGYAKSSTVTTRVFVDSANNDTDTGTHLTGVTATLTRLKSDGGGGYVTDNSFTPVTNPAVGQLISFAGLLPGVYEVTYNNIGANYLTTTRNNKPASGGLATAVFTANTRTWRVTVPSDDQQIYLPTGVVEQASLSGVVWVDANANGIYAIPGESPYAAEPLAVGLYRADTSGTPIATTAIDGNGAFSFTGLYPGNDYIVVLTPPTSGTWYVTNTRASGNDVKANPWQFGNISVAANGSVTINFGIVQPMSITGRVWEDIGANGANGVYNADDATTAGKALRVTGTDGRGNSVNSTTTTDSDGGYTFSGLIPGTYTVTLTDNSYAAYVLSNVTTATGNATLNKGNKAWSLTGASGYAQTDCDFALTTSSVISGTVWHDLNADGSKAASDPYLANMEIKIYKYINAVNYDPTPVYTSPATDVTTGSYAYRDAVVGKYRVELASSTGWVVTNPASGAIYQDVEITMLGSTRTADFGIARYVTFSGRVWTELDGNGAYDAGDTKIDNHSVTITRNSGVPIVKTTNNDGVFEITATDTLLPGQFTVVFDGYQAGYVVTNTNSRAGFTWDTDTRTWSFSLNSGANAAELNCAFTPLRKITGNIWHDLDANGALNGVEQYLASLTVTLSKWNGSAWVTVTNAGGQPVTSITNASGFFEFQGLLPGTYRATVSASGYKRTNPTGTQNMNDLYADYVFGAGVGETAVVKDVQIGLANPVSISGIAYIDKDSSGAYSSGDGYAVVGVKIERTAPNPQIFTDPVTFKTNAAGGSYSTYGLTLLPGTYVITFDAVANYVASNSAQGFSAARRQWTITLSSGANRTDIDIGYKRGNYAITGYVWKDVDGDFIKDPGEEHFTSTDNIKLVLNGTPYFGPVMNDGTFAVAVDSPGAYTLKFDAINGLPAGYSVTNRDAPFDRGTRSFSVTLTYDDFTQHVDIGAAMASTISGVIWMDYSGNGIFTASAAPVRAVSIQLIDENGNMEAETVTGNNGEYVFADVKPGSYTVRFASPVTVTNSGKAFYTGDASNPLSASMFDARTGVWTLDVVGGSDITDANSGVHEPSSISGTLLNVTTSQPQGGAPVALYKVLSDGTREKWLEVDTDNNGEYSFGMLLPGSYELGIGLPQSYEKQSGDGSQRNDKVIIEGINILGMGEESVKETRISKTSPNNNNNNTGGGRGGAVLPSNSNAPMDLSIAAANTELPPDTGQPADTGLPPDTGQPADTGLPADIGQPAEPGLPTDTGLPVDTGLPTVPGSSVTIIPDTTVEPPPGLSNVIRNTVLPPNAGSLPNGSFVDSKGDILLIPDNLVVAMGFPNIFAELDEYGNVKQYWQRIQIGDKYLYILLDSSLFASLPKTGDTGSVVLRTAIASLVAGLLLLFFIMRKRYER